LSTRSKFNESENVVRSPWPAVETPKETLFTHVFAHQEFDRTKTAVIDGISGKKVSYNEILEMISKVGSALLKEGLAQGDSLAIVSPNSIEFAVQFFATSAIRCVVSTINAAFTSKEIAYQLKDCGAKYVATTSSVLLAVKEAAHRVGIPNNRIIVLDVDGQGEHISFEKLLKDSGSSFPSEGAQLDPECIATLPYSSGTTGLPKGVMLTHSNMVANLCQIDHPNLVGFNHNSVVMCVMPFSHIYGITVIMSYGLKKGSCLVSLPHFDPTLFLHAMAEYKITNAPLVPPLILFLTKHPLVDDYQLSHLRQVFCGGAPLTGELAVAARERLGKNVVIHQGYGLTETSPVAHCSPKNTNKPGSIGPPVPNTQVAIIDKETGVPLSSDKVGEVVIRGPQVMQGYFDRPKETAACLTSDGWFHSGDVGYYDEEGHFYITDRLKELIKVKGYQVAPAELEGVLLEHPQIADCAVVGVADERLGEVPKAFVVCKSKNVSENNITTFVAAKLSKHKHLKGGVVFVDSIPKSPSGKILRRLLRN
jgi:acyl-CoA synthetase (AMP-forming)/AMP-acid ligase II